MRKCRYCKAELPKKKDCTDGAQRAGFCSLDHMAEHGKAKAMEQKARAWRKEKAAKNAEARAERKDIRRRKEAIKAKPQLTKEAQQAFNQFIRLRDHDQPCICCGQWDDGSDGWKPGGAWDAGHFLSVGSHPELRFTESNCYKQLKSCNAGAGKYTRKGHTVSAQYEQRLRDIKGNDLVDWLLGPHEMPNWTHDDLREIRDKYRRKVREMKRNNEHCS